MKTEKKESRMKNDELAVQQKQLQQNESTKKITAASKMFAVKVKSPAKRAFYYQGVNDLQNLCSVVGATPKMDFTPNGIAYSFSKKLPSILNDSQSVIIVDGNGTIENIFSKVRFDEIYDVQAERDIEISDFAKEKK